MKSERLGNATVAFSKGVMHEHYEDRYAWFPLAKPAVRCQNRGEIFAVFDGISSMADGMHSAQHMCEVLMRYYQFPDDNPATREGIERLLLAGNMEVSGWGGPAPAGGGCAGSIVWLHTGNLYTFHTGDTVVALIRDGKPLQLTNSHVVNGAIERYFGLGASLRMDVAQQRLRNYDRILLMSDDVTDVYDINQVTVIVRENDNDIKQAVEEIARRARANGGRDDITVLMVEYEPCTE